MGWKLLRGSSSDRGKEVYKEMVNILADTGNVLVLTPDGPKGPAKEPKPGIIRAAQKTNAVILPNIYLLVLPKLKALLVNHNIPTFMTTFLQ